MNDYVSGYIANQAEEERRARARFEALGAITHEVRALPADALPPMPMVNLIGSHDHGHFKAIGIDLFNEIAARLRLHPGSTILDLGCGCGRMAIPFIRFLSEGRFYGCDGWADGIRWCRDNLTERGNAEFHVNSLANNYYLDDFDGRASNDCTLPWLADEALDAAYAISLFTHLTRRDAEGYLGEIGRALKPEGLAYLTFFVIDKFFFRYRQRTGLHDGLRETEPGCFHGYQRQDFFGGFRMETLHEMFAGANLRPIAFEPGSWAEKPGSRVYQDTFIVERIA